MNDVDWGVRAAAWELAALSFRYPGAELAGAVASGEWAEAAREIAAALGLALPDVFVNKEIDISLCRFSTLRWQAPTHLPS